MLQAGFFSGLVTHTEIGDLLNILYGSYGERLIVSYKKEAKRVQLRNGIPLGSAPMGQAFGKLVFLAAGTWV